MSQLDSIVYQPTQNINSAIVWLHGLGADGHDFSPLAKEWNFPNTRCIFPHAPIKKVTLNGNLPMRAWYDVFNLSIDGPEDEKGIRNMQINIEQLLNQQITSGIESKRIILVGFSQGGAMALHTGLRFPHTLGAIVALSAYLPLHQSLAQELHPAQINTPIFMAHGRFDPVLPWNFGHFSKTFLCQHQLHVNWHEYSMEHAVCAEELRDLNQFLMNVLNDIYHTA